MCRAPTHLPQDLLCLGQLRRDAGLLRALRTGERAFRGPVRPCADQDTDDKDCGVPGRLGGSVTRCPARADPHQ